MLSAVFAFAGSMLAAVMLTPMVRRFAIWLGAMDAPDERRVHLQATPRLGGLAIVAAFFASMFALFVTESEVARIFFATPKLILGLVVGGLLVCALGALDDVRGVHAWHKLACQCLAALAAYACGFRIDAIKLPLFGDLEMGVFGVLVTMLWIVAIINAINLIDGLDGLAGGVVFFACITNLVVAAINHDVVVMLLSSALGGATLGFLLFNFSPASIFMGDSGSMFLGYTLATTSILGNSVKSSTTVAILVPFVALGLPIIDTLLAMLRRLLERRSIFAADRRHIHHQLLAMGLTQRRAVLTLYGLSILFTTGAIVVSVGRNTAVGAALVVIAITAVGVVRVMGNVDGAFRRWLRKERIRSPLVDRIRFAVPSVLRQIANANQPHDVVIALEEFARLIRMDSVRLAAAPGGRLEPFQWKSQRTPSIGLSRPSATAHYALQEIASGVLHFSWARDAGDLDPDVDILLQLVADAIDEHVRRENDAHRSASTVQLRSM
jgi:UDP-GlcNAc:undecaprenyl-phosphate/decaprenyl-phosphate GlcNAc-1-phosphate transferase